jgi:hypothetical protein
MKAKTKKSDKKSSPDPIPQGNKVEFSYDYDPEYFVALYLGAAKNNPELGDKQKDVVGKITSTEIKLVVAVVKYYNKNGGVYLGYINSILGDIKNLIKHCHSKESFAKMKANPSDPHINLTKAMQAVISQFSSAQDKELQEDLQKQGESPIKGLINKVSDLIPSFHSTEADASGSMVKDGEKTKSNGDAKEPKLVGDVDRSLATMLSLGDYNDSESSTLNN